jgi:hypothetical protein
MVVINLSGSRGIGEAPGQDWGGARGYKGFLKETVLVETRK